MLLRCRDFDCECNGAARVAVAMPQMMPYAMLPIFFFFATPLLMLRHARCHATPYARYIRYVMPFQRDCCCRRLFSPCLRRYAMFRHLLIRRFMIVFRFDASRRRYASYAAMLRLPLMRRRCFDAATPSRHMSAPLASAMLLIPRRCCHYLPLLRAG